jgi:hypothetical protein
MEIATAPYGRIAMTDPGPLRYSASAIAEISRP